VEGHRKTFKISVKLVRRDSKQASCEYKSEALPTETKSSVQEREIMFAAITVVSANSTVF
jgi:hypothetical protein